MTLEEVQTKLQDDPVNFMGLSATKDISYLNFEDTVKDGTFVGSDSQKIYRVSIALSSN